MLTYVLSNDIECYAEAVAPELFSITPLLTSPLLYTAEIYLQENLKTSTHVYTFTSSPSFSLQREHYSVGVPRI